MARKIGTAPRNPTQATNSRSRAVKRNGVRHSQTATGRATRISTSATPSAGRMRGRSWAGTTISPSMMKSTSCDSQAIASWNRAMVWLAR